LLEGDSDDSEHHWWCEVRDCGDLENPGRRRAKTENKDKEPRSWFKTVALKKRVDWGSTQLFIKCCEAAEAAAKKSDDVQGKGLIDQVTVHICRPSGGKKIPFLTVKYFNVQITHYEVDISEPEPSEDIKFEFEAVEFEYQRTDPYTGVTTGDAVRVNSRITSPKLKWRR
jgi:type VI protein secretion system component Hcp